MNDPAADQFAPRLAATIARQAEGDPFLAHQEGHLKIVAIHALLRMGHLVHEGSSLPHIGWTASRHPHDSGRPVWTKGPRVHRKLEGGSTDLASTDPHPPQPVRLFEMKAFPDHGSKMAVRASLHDDLVRAAENPDIVVVAAFDPVALLAFNGGKTERRGRKGKHPHLLSAMPSPDLLPPGATHVGEFTVRGVTLVRAAVRTPPDGGALGVTVAVFSHPDGPAATPPR